MELEKKNKKEKKHLPVIACVDSIKRRKPWKVANQNRQWMELTNCEKFVFSFLYLTSKIRTEYIEQKRFTALQACFL